MFFNYANCIPQFHTHHFSLNFHQGAFCMSHLLIPNHMLSTFNYHQGAFVVSHLLIPNHTLSTPTSTYMASCGEPLKITSFLLLMVILTRHLSTFHSTSTTYDFRLCQWHPSNSYTSSLS